MEFEHKQIRGKTIQLYPEAFKRAVIEEYLAGSVTKMDLLRKYGIKTKSGIQRWMKRLGYTDTHRPLCFIFKRTHSFALMKKTNVSQLSPEALQAKIKELEQQLEDEKLRSEAYARMLEKAQQQLRGPIEKKSATK